MSNVLFEHDLGVELKLPYHRLSGDFSYRKNCEWIFRRIHSYLILNRVITDNFIDLGAWIGDNTIPWAKNKKEIIYSIDPCEENCRFIEEVAKVNKLTNVKTIQKAISDKKETLVTDDDISHCSFVYREAGPVPKNKIDATTLDDLHKDGIISDIGYIHLDVEGMEFRVVIGAEELIKKYRPVISFEQHIEKDDVKGLSNHLREKGYSIYLINEIMPHCAPDCRNLLAFPIEKDTPELIENIHNYLCRDNILIKQ